MKNKKKLKELPVGTVVAIYGVPSQIIEHLNNGKTLLGDPDGIVKGTVSINSDFREFDIWYHVDDTFGMSEQDRENFIYAIGHTNNKVERLAVIKNKKRIVSMSEIELNNFTDELEKWGNKTIERLKIIRFSKRRRLRKVPAGIVMLSQVPIGTIICTYPDALWEVGGVKVDSHHLRVLEQGLSPWDGRSSGYDVSLEVLDGGETRYLPDNFIGFDIVE